MLIPRPELQELKVPMASIESLYKAENGHVLIEMKLSSVMQLFNSFDPAPFHEKEMDQDAENYIIDAVKDFPPKTRFKIVIYLPDSDTNTKVSAGIGRAVKSHFENRALVQNRKFRQRLVYGEFALVVGLAFLAIAVLASVTVDAYSSQYPVAHLLSKALEITGWVAMWEPVTVFLFQLWPIVKEKRIYEKISRLEIDIRPYPRVYSPVPALQAQPPRRIRNS